MMKKILFAAITLSLLLLVVSCKRNNNSDIATDSTQTVQPNDEENLDASICASNEETSIVAEVQHINTEEFVKLVCDIDNPKGFQYKGRIPAIVDLYASWCGSCNRLSPLLSEMAKQYAGKIIIYKVDVDKNPDVASAFDAQSIPTLLFFKPNQQPVKSVGAPGKQDLEKMIQDLLLKN